MTRALRAIRKRQPKPDGRSTGTDKSEYRVGPGRPPREYQFKPGQSGNPKGARRKGSSIAPDLKALLETALGTKILSKNDKKRIMTKAAAGIENLVNQFAEGDRHARRDVIDLARKLGVDLVAGEGQLIEQALEENLPKEDEALLADYVRRHRDDPTSDDGDPETGR